MKAVRHILDLVLAVVSSFLLIVMVAVLTWQVFSRYALNSPSTFSEEMLRYGVIWLSMLGAAYATGQSSHMMVDFFREKTQGKLRDTLELCVPIAFIIFSIFVLIYGGILGMQNAQNQYSPVLRIPMAYIYLSLPVSGIFMLIYSFLNIANYLQNKKGQTLSKKLSEKGA